MRSALYIALLSSLIFIAPACDDNDPYAGDCFIPSVNVNEVLNLTLPEYFRLQNMGEYIFLENAGNKGIFVVHNYDDYYYAIERTCPFQSDLSCAKVEVDSVNLQLRCGTTVDTGFVECCGSRYLFDGLLVQGPSRCNLKNYSVNIQNNSLFISN